MQLEWRGRVARHILNSKNPPQNFYDPIYGHIGTKILDTILGEHDIKKPHLPLNILLEKFGQRLHINLNEYSPIPVKGIEDVIIAIDRSIPKGNTAYILPWYHQEEEIYKTLFRPYFKIPIEGLKPREGMLQYNYEYKGIYHLKIPDRYTGEIYLDLLKEYVETILEVGGYLILDITYIHTVEDFNETAEKLLRMIEPISRRVIFYIDLSRSYINPKAEYCVAYSPYQITDIIINHRGINIAGLLDDTLPVELFTLDLLWNEYLNQVRTTLESKKKILKRNLKNKFLESSYTLTIGFSGSLELAEKLLNENIIVEPIETPLEGITIDLYTDAEEEAMEKLIKNFMVE